MSRAILSHWTGQRAPNHRWKIQIPICSCHSEGAEKRFGHASHWQHFKINLYCPKQCHVERSQSGLGSWPAAQDARDGYVCLAEPKNPSVVLRVARSPPRRWDAQLLIRYSKHTCVKRKLPSQMASKNNVLNPTNFHPANGALNLPCGLACLWLLCPLRERRKTFCAEMKAETWLGRKKKQLE